MSFEPITVSSFEFYVRHLKQDLKKENDVQFLTEPFIYGILTENLTEVSVFFNDKDKPIDEVAQLLFKVLCSSYDCNRNGECTYSLEFIMQIKTLLRLIKYSCTILHEDTVHSKFEHKTAFELMSTDNELDPSSWLFMNNDLFMTKVLCSIGQNTISRICPVTDFRLKQVWNIHNYFRSSPILVLKDDYYTLSLKKMFVETGIIESDSDDCINKVPFSSVNLSTSGKKYRPEGVYVGKQSYKFDRTFSKKYQKLYESLNDFLVGDYKDFEVVFTVEYALSREYMVIVYIKIFVFKKEKDVGYVLHGSFFCSSKDAQFVSMSYTHALSKRFIEELLYVFYKYFDDLNVFMPIEGQSLNYAKSPEAKLFKQIELFVRNFSQSFYSPCTPDFILYP